MTFRAAILIQAYGRFGGAERAALLNYSQLKRMGKDVDLFADFTDTRPWDSGLDHAELKHLTRPANLSQALKILKELDSYDRILIHHHVEPVLAYLITRYLKKKVDWYSGSIFEAAYSNLLYGEDYKKVSVTLGETTRSFYGKYLGVLGLSMYSASKMALKMLDLRTVRNYRKIYANSRYQARYLKNVYKRDSKVVYPPLEEMRGSSKSLDSKIPFVLMAGAFVYYKNFEAGIRAMEGIKDSHSLVIAGSGPLGEKYEELARRLGIRLRISFGESDETMSSLYEGSSFVIHPSLFEGFGYVSAEAAMHKRPTILTTHSGAAEFFKDGESAYICDPRDIALIRERAGTLANDQARAEEMGVKAYNAIQELCGGGQSKELWSELEG